MLVRTFLAATVLSLSFGPAFAQELSVYGNFQHMLHSGDSKGTVKLEDVAVPRAWGVGALAGLQGEVLIADGKVLVSRGNDAQARVTVPEKGEEAVILATGMVKEWHTVQLPHDMESEQLAHFISAQAKNLEIVAETGFPIRLQGTFPKLSWHVVTGATPDKSNHGQKKHGNPQAMAPSGSNSYVEDGSQGEIVGVFAGDMHVGKASHPGELLHLHFLDSKRERSGHVDVISFLAGTQLLLPVKTEEHAAEENTGGTHMHGQDGTGHDEVTMPGLRGENASLEESAELAVMFGNFKTITRDVQNLPDGIRTVTKSSDPTVMANLVSHVTGMIGRVENGQDPKIIIQSKTLDIFFARGQGITSNIEVTDEGIVVVQTSKDPEVVAALHTHAAEVSDMAARGMEAVHERMMKKGN